MFYYNNNIKPAHVPNTGFFFMKSVIERDDLFQAVAVSQVKKRGAELRGDIIAHEKEMLIRIRQLQILENQNMISRGE